MDNRNVERKGWDWDKMQGEQRAFWTEPEGALIPFVSRIARERVRRVYDLGCGIRAAYGLSGAARLRGVRL